MLYFHQGGIGLIGLNCKPTYYLSSSMIKDVFNHRISEKNSLTPTYWGKHDNI